MNPGELRYTNFAQIHVAAHEEFWKSFGRGFSTASLGAPAYMRKLLVIPIIAFAVLMLGACATIGQVEVAGNDLESPRQIDSLLKKLYYELGYRDYQFGNGESYFASYTNDELGWIGHSERSNTLVIRIVPLPHGDATIVTIDIARYLLSEAPDATVVVTLSEKLDMLR